MDLKAIVDFFASYPTWAKIVALGGVAMAVGTLTFVPRRGPEPVVGEPPLQGIWQFSIAYTRFHKTEGAWSALGEAVVVWKSREQRYDVYFGAQIKAASEAKPIVASFSHGYIQAGDSGWPSPNFSIDDIHFIARADTTGAEPSAQSYQYTDCSYTKSGARADEIHGSFATPASAGRIKLKWKGQLH